MPIQYSLLENQLTSDPDDYRAQVQDSVVWTEENIIDAMTSRGSTATKAEVLAVLEEYKLAIEGALADGKRINTELVNIAPSVRGVFQGSDDSFDTSRHSISLNLTPGTRLRRVSGEVQVEKVHAGVAGPILDRFVDAVSDEADALVTPGGAGTLTGINLKILTDLDDSGVFFVGGDGSSTQVVNLIRNKPAELIFMIPALDPGDYQLEVRTALHGSSLVRRGRLEAVLTVAG